MIDRGRETVEFGTRVAHMQERLAKRGVAVQQADYAAEAFGSWHIVAGTPQKQFDFSYDGKDSYLMYRDAAVIPNNHCDLQHKRFQTWRGEDPLVYVEEVLVQEFSADDTKA